MNKYLCKINYNYSKFGVLTCYIYADSEEEAEDLAVDYQNRHCEDYDDSENDGDMDFSYDDMEFELEEENAESPDNDSTSNDPVPSLSRLPEYFLAELLLI